jgi:hypothetical protein
LIFFLYAFLGEARACGDVEEEHVMHKRKARVLAVLVPGAAALMAIKGQERKRKRQALPPAETTVAE